VPSSGHSRIGRVETKLDRSCVRIVPVSVLRLAWEIAGRGRGRDPFQDPSQSGSDGGWRGGTGAGEGAVRGGFLSLSCGLPPSCGMGGVARVGSPGVG
jgi:hypothetical protein